MSTHEGFNGPSQQSEHEYGPGVANREATLDIPSIERIHHVMSGLQVGTAYEQSASRQTAQQFQRSRHVIVDADSLGGMGDFITLYRHARVMAEASPDKAFYIKTHRSVQGMQGIKVPVNAVLTRDIPADTATRSDTFCVDLGLDFYSDSGLETDVRTDIKRRHRISDEKTSLFLAAHTGYAQTIYSALGIGHTAEQLRRSPINLRDTRYIARMIELGIDVPRNALQHSFLETEALGNKTIDLVIAPDALGDPFMSVGHGYRTHKSLPPETWQEIAGILPPDCRIAILRGTAHPRYCQDVFHAVFNARRGRGVHEVQTATLNDFIRLVQCTVTYAGMDSGTTHLAAEVALATHGTMGTTAVRYLSTYTSAELMVGECGIRGLGTQLKTLEVYRKDRQEIPFGFSGLAPDAASFIQS